MRGGRAASAIVSLPRKAVAGPTAALTRADRELSSHDGQGGDWLPSGSARIQRRPLHARRALFKGPLWCAMYYNATRDRRCRVKEFASLLR